MSLVLRLLTLPFRIYRDLGHALCGGSRDRRENSDSNHSKSRRFPDDSFRRQRAGVARSEALSPSPWAPSLSSAWYQPQWNLGKLHNLSEPHFLISEMGVLS